MSYSEVGEDLICDHGEFAFLADSETVLLQKDERFERVDANQKEINLLQLALDNG